MNFGQERYSWMEQDPYTGDKMPFYMTYPMQNTLFEEEYEGSMMYDRYPDRLMLEMLCRKIYRELNPDHIDEEGRLQVEERYFHLIQVMLMQEMYRRRCRHYRCRRWY